MYQGKGITAFEGEQIRVAFHQDYPDSIQALLTAITPTTVYTLNSHDEYGLYLMVGADANDKNGVWFFAPWSAIAAVAPANLAQMESKVA